MTTPVTPPSEAEISQAIERLKPGLDHMRPEFQRQLDFDGCEVGVSRQAADETVELCDLLLRAYDGVKGDNERLRENIAQVYQAVGNIADAGGSFEHPDVQTVLDWLANPDLALDILPFPKTPLPETVEKLVEAQAALAAMQPRTADDDDPPTDGSFTCIRCLAATQNDDDICDDCRAESNQKD